MTRRFVLWTVIAALAVGLFSASQFSAADTPLYEREESVGPLRLSYEDLWQTVSRVRAIVSTADAKAKESEDAALVSESLRLKDNHGTTFTLGENFTQSDLRGAPEMATDIWYSYSLRGAPIASVELRFADYARTINVSGTAREQVDALVGMLMSDTARYASLLGGMNQRLFLPLVAMVVGFAILIVALLKGWLVIALAGFSIGPLLYLSAIFIPWSSLLPGTAVFVGDASWLVRHNAELTLIGVLISIASIFLSPLVPRLFKRPAEVVTAPPVAATQQAPEVNGQSPQADDRKD